MVPELEDVEIRMRPETNAGFIAVSERWRVRWDAEQAFVDSVAEVLATEPAKDLRDEPEAQLRIRYRVRSLLRSFHRRGLLRRVWED